jgi:hypothetical protein
VRVFQAMKPLAVACRQGYALRCPPKAENLETRRWFPRQSAASLQYNTNLQSNCDKSRGRHQTIWQSAPSPRPSPPVSGGDGARRAGAGVCLSVRSILNAISYNIVRAPGCQS